MPKHAKFAHLLIVWQARAACTCEGHPATSYVHKSMLRPATEHTLHMAVSTMSASRSTGVSSFQAVARRSRISALRLASENFRLASTTHAVQTQVPYCTYRSACHLNFSSTACPPCAHLRGSGGVSCRSSFTLGRPTGSACGRLSSARSSPRRSACSARLASCAVRASASTAAATNCSAEVAA